MSEQYISTAVRSYSAGLVGRSLNTARNQHFVIDSPTIGEALGSGEAFLAGVSSCGVTLCENAARQMGVPLQRMEVTIEGLREKDRPANFARVEMRFTLYGVDQEQADAVVQRYKDG